MVNVTRSRSRPFFANLGNPARFPARLPARDRCQFQYASTAPLMPSANASLLTCGHHASPVSASAHSAPLARFHRIRIAASDGIPVSSPLSRYRARSSFKVRTAQLRAYRRPPNCRRTHAACSGVQSSANTNACTTHPSGTSNLPTKPPDPAATPASTRPASTGTGTRTPSTHPTCPTPSS